MLVGKTKYGGLLLALLFLFVIVLTIFIIKPFIIPILTAFIFVYIFYPIYEKVKRFVKNDWISSAIMVLLIGLIILIPSFFVFKTIVSEALGFYSTFDYKEAIDFFSGYLDESIVLYIEDLLQEAILFIAKQSSQFILSLPQKIVGMFVTFFLMFYFFKEGNRMFQKVKEKIPLQNKYKYRLIRRFREVVNGIVYGLIAISIIEGILGTLGLMLFNVKHPFLWGGIIAFFGLIPLIGPGMIWGPIGAIKLIKGDMFNGIGLLLYGILVLSTIDNLLRPKIIGRRGELHPALVLVGILGGLSLFGMIGILLGPIVLAILQLLFEFYFKKEGD